MWCLSINKAPFIALILLSLLLLGVANFQLIKANSNALIVPDNFPTIMAALGNATEGDTILVRRGVYHENVKVREAISLVGEDRDACVIDGNLGEGFRAPLFISHGGATIAGFTFRGGYNAVRMSNVNYCKITENRVTDTQYGITLLNGSENSVTANVIDSIRTAGYGIELSYSSNNNIQRNIITSASVGIAIKDQPLGPSSASSTQSNTIVENNITNSEEYAIMIVFSNSNTIVGNNITNSGKGVSLYESDGNVIYRNNFFGNTVQAGAGVNEPDYSGNGIRASVGNWNENYWSDYTGTDANGDGFGDTPYVINEKNADNRPSITPLAVSSTLPVTAPTSTPTSATESPSPALVNSIPTQSALSTSPSPSASCSLSDQKPTSTPEQQPTAFPTEILLPVAFAIAVLVVVGTTFLLSRKRSKAHFAEALRSTQCNQKLSICVFKPCKIRLLLESLIYRPDHAIK